MDTRMYVCIQYAYKNRREYVYQYKEIRYVYIHIVMYTDIYIKYIDKILCHSLHALFSIIGYGG